MTNLLKGLILGIIISVLIFALGFALGNPTLFFLTSIVALFLFVYSLFQKEIFYKIASFTVILGPVLILILMMYIQDKQGQIAQKKLEVVVREINEYRSNTDRYPQSLNQISKGNLTTWMYFMNREINVYEVKGDFLKVGWDYNDKRVIYDNASANDFMRYKNNMELRF